MTKFEQSVLFEREGDTPIGPEVGRREGHDVVFVDGTRVRIEDGDFVDPISRECESWDHEGLIALARGLEARTRRRLAALEK